MFEWLFPAPDQPFLPASDLPTRPVRDRAPDGGWLAGTAAATGRPVADCPIAPPIHPETCGAGPDDRDMPDTHGRGGSAFFLHKDAYRVLNHRAWSVRPARATPNLEWQGRD